MTMIELLGPEIPQESLALYPIGAAAVSVVLDSLARNFSDRNRGQYLNRTIPMIESENPYVNGFLVDMSDDYSGQRKDGFQIGVALGYELLQARAGDLDLPIVSGKFVTVYQQMKESRLLEVHGKSLQSRERGRIEEEQIRKGLFLLLEPEVYQVFQEELMAPGCSFYDTTIFSGLVASYFLFRQGFSDENFWEDDFVEDLDPTDSQVSQE